MDWPVSPCSLRAVWRAGPVWAVALCLATGTAAQGPAPADAASPDPWGPATTGMPSCPVPAAPRYSAEEVRAMAHERAQHGTSCYQSGRCRLPNSYVYDAEIVPRVQQFLRQDGRFATTSVWVLGQRRIVTLMGCVADAQQARALVQAAAQVDDVMGVVDWLWVAAPGRTPPYPVAVPR